MGTKLLRVCDYCGKPLNQYIAEAQKEPEITTTTITVGTGIDIAMTRIEPGLDMQQRTLYVESIDACNFIHFSLALKRMAEEQFAKPHEEWPTDDTKRSKIHWKDVDPEATKTFFQDRCNWNTEEE